MDRTFPKEYVGFYYTRKNHLYYSLVLSEKAAVEWEKLDEKGCEVIHMEDLEEDREIKSFLIRGIHYAEIWPKLAS